MQTDPLAGSERNGLSARQRVSKRTAIDQIELTAERYAMSDTAKHEALGNQQLGDVMGSGLTFDGWVGRQDGLAEAAFGDAYEQLGNTDGLGAQAVKWRKVPLEHKIAAAKAGLLDCKDIYRALNDAQQRIISTWVGTLAAKFFLAQGTAPAAVTNVFHRTGERLRQAQAATAITFKHLQGHALSTLLPYSRQDTQRIDKLADKWTEAH